MAAKDKKKLVKQAKALMEGKASSTISSETRAELIVLMTRLVEG